MIGIVHDDGGRSQDQRGLRRTRLDDIDGLHALTCLPPVYRYLFDGVPPTRESIAQRVAQSVRQPDASDLAVSACAFRKMCNIPLAPARNTSCIVTILTPALLPLA
jgi:hypothetical protein